MAFILTPRFASAYQAPQCNPFGSCASESRPTYGYRVARPRPQRPQSSSFNHFFSQIDDLLSEIDREAQQQQAHVEAQQQAQLEARQQALLEAQRQAHIEAQRRQAELEAQRKAHLVAQIEALCLQKRERSLKAQFTVNQTEQGWQVNGDIPGFTQENVKIEIANESTLKIAGNTRWQAEKKAQPKQLESQPDASSTTEQQAAETTLHNDSDVEAANEPDFETITRLDTDANEAAASDSDNESHKSYQPTVEDDFEDLGAESSSLISIPSRPSSPAEVKEPKGKEKAVEPTAAKQVVTSEQPQQEERVHGSFERTFRFPERIDVANVSASFKDGALRINIPKAPVQQIRRIVLL
jgi:HSP20 family molecular chaperone IbpA